MEFRVGSRAPDAVVLAPGERELPLVEIAVAGPAVLFFLRHFG